MSWSGQGGYGHNMNATGNFNNSSMYNPGIQAVGMMPHQLPSQQLPVPGNNTNMYSIPQNSATSQHFTNNHATNMQPMWGQPSGVSQPVNNVNQSQGQQWQSGGNQSFQQPQQWNQLPGTNVSMQSNWQNQGLNAAQPHGMMVPQQQIEYRNQPTGAINQNSSNCPICQQLVPMDCWVDHANTHKNAGSVAANQSRPTLNSGSSRKSGLSTERDDIRKIMSREFLETNYSIVNDVLEKCAGRSHPLVFSCDLCNINDMSFDDLISHTFEISHMKRLHLWIGAEGSIGHHKYKHYLPEEAPSNWTDFHFCECCLKLAGWHPNDVTKHVNSTKHITKVQEIRARYQKICKGFSPYRRVDEERRSHRNASKPRGHVETELGSSINKPDVKEILNAIRSSSAVNSEQPKSSLEQSTHEVRMIPSYQENKYSFKDALRPSKERLLPELVRGSRRNDQWIADVGDRMEKKSNLDLKYMEQDHSTRSPSRNAHQYTHHQAQKRENKEIELSQNRKMSDEWKPKIGNKPNYSRGKRSDQERSSSKPNVRSSSQQEQMKKREYDMLDASHRRGVSREQKQMTQNESTYLLAEHRMRGQDWHVSASGKSGDKNKQVVEVFSKQLDHGSHSKRAYDKSTSSSTDRSYHEKAVRKEDHSPVYVTPVPAKRARLSVEHGSSIHKSEIQASVDSVQLNKNKEFVVKCRNRLCPRDLSPVARDNLTKVIENTWNAYYRKYQDCNKSNPEIVLELQKEYLRSYKGFFTEDPYFEYYYAKLAKPEDLREALTLRIDRGSPGPEPQELIQNSSRSTASNNSESLSRRINDHSSTSSRTVEDRGEMKRTNSVKASDQPKSEHLRNNGSVSHFKERSFKNRTNSPSHHMIDAKSVETEELSSINKLHSQPKRRSRSPNVQGVAAKKSLKGGNFEETSCGARINSSRLANEKKSRFPVKDHSIKESKPENSRLQAQSSSSRISPKSEHSSYDHLASEQLKSKRSYSRSSHRRGVRSPSTVMKNSKSSNDDRKLNSVKAAMENDRSPTSSGHFAERSSRVGHHLAQRDKSLSREKSSRSNNSRDMDYRERNHDQRLMKQSAGKSSNTVDFSEKKSSELYKTERPLLETSLSALTHVVEYQHGAVNFNHLSRSQIGANQSELSSVNNQSKDSIRTLYADGLETERTEHKSSGTSQASRRSLTPAQHSSQHRSHSPERHQKLKLNREALVEEYPKGSYLENDGALLPTPLSAPSIEHPYVFDYAAGSVMTRLGEKLDKSTESNSDIMQRLGPLRSPECSDLVPDLEIFQEPFLDFVHQTLTGMIVMSQIHSAMENDAGNKELEATLANEKKAMQERMVKPEGHMLIRMAIFCVTSPDELEDSFPQCNPRVAAVLRNLDPDILELIAQTPIIEPGAFNFE